MDIQGFEEFEEFLTRILERNYRRLPARQSEVGAGDGDDRNRRTGGYGNYGGRRGYGGDRRNNNTAISRQTAAYDKSDGSGKQNGKTSFKCFLCDKPNCNIAI